MEQPGSTQEVQKAMDGKEEKLNRDSMLTVLREAAGVSPRLDSEKLLSLMAQAKDLVANDLKDSLPKPPFASAENPIGSKE